MSWTITTTTAKGAKVVHRAHNGPLIAKVTLPAGETPTDADFDLAYATAFATWKAKHDR